MLTSIFANGSELRANVEHVEHDKQHPKKLTLKGDGELVIRTDEAGLRAIAKAIIDHPTDFLKRAERELQEAQQKLDSIRSTMVFTEASPEAAPDQ